VVLLRRGNLLSKYKISNKGIMKKILLFLSFIGIALLSHAQIKMPAPSSTQMIRQDFALGTIELTYSRPSIKGRKIFGDLVPYDKVWRTGANGATIIRFTDPVEIGGKKIDTGSYALYTVPHEDSWEIVLNKGIKNWGTEGYKESDDVVRFKVPVLYIKARLETFTMQFADIAPESCKLQLMWDNAAVTIPIKSNIRDRIRAAIEQEMITDKKPYWNAAQFYYEYDQDDAKALENVKAAVAANPKAYYMWLYKAKIEKDMGDKTAAMASSQKSLELALEAKNDDYVKMNEDLQKKLK
jgi:hypothetical protein